MTEARDPIAAARARLVRPVLRPAQPRTGSVLERLEALETGLDALPGYVAHHYGRPAAHLIADAARLLDLLEQRVTALEQRTEQE